MNRDYKKYINGPVADPVENLLQNAFSLLCSAAHRGRVSGASVLSEMKKRFEAKELDDAIDKKLSKKK